MADGLCLGCSWACRCMCNEVSQMYTIGSHQSRCCFKAGCRQHGAWDLCCSVVLVTEQGSAAHWGLQMDLRAFLPSLQALSGQSFLHFDRLTGDCWLIDPRASLAALHAISSSKAQMADDGSPAGRPEVSRMQALCLGLDPALWLPSCHLIICPSFSKALAPANDHYVCPNIQLLTGFNAQMQGPERQAGTDTPRSTTTC